MELFYLLYLNGVVRILLSYQSPALVSCDINQHCTVGFLFSYVVAKGETMNYIEYITCRPQKAPGQIYQENVNF